MSLPKSPSILFFGSIAIGKGKPLPFRSSSYAREQIQNLPSNVLGSAHSQGKTLSKPTTT
jgi:hypothetical protein